MSAIVFSSANYVSRWDGVFGAICDTLVILLTFSRLMVGFQN